MHDQAVRFILGACLLFLRLLSPAQSLKCYECTSDDIGCISNVNSSSMYEKDCPGAVGCMLHMIEYDFAIPSVFFRTCLYEGDKICYLKDFEYKKNIVYVSNRNRKWTYPSTLACLKKSRFEGGLPEPLTTKRSLPEDSAQFSHLVFENTDLENSWDWKDFGFSRGNKVTKQPQPLDLVCYSCEAEIPETGFDEFNENAGRTLLPDCGNNKNPSSISCKNASGCAAFWEVRKEAKIGHVRNVSRMLRGCWYSGDQKCLRYPDSINSSVSGRTEQAESSCGRSYKTGRTTGVDVVWAGARVIQTSSKYNEYLQCTHQARRRAGAESILQQVMQVDSEETAFARIRYFYCGPGDKCNDGTPLPPPSTSTTTTTVTDVNGNGVGGGGGTKVDNKFSNTTFIPGLGETGQPDCYTRKRTSENGAIQRYYGTSKAAFLLTFVALFQNYMQY